MTGLPASQLGLADRGVLAVGRRADVTVFDAPAIRDLATFADPEQLPEGVRHVLVNGIPVVRDGGHTGSLPGRVIRRQDLR